MLHAFDYMEAHQFATDVLEKIGFTQMSEVFPHPSVQTVARIHDMTAKVIHSIDPVQRATVLRLVKDREYRSMVCPKKNRA